MPGKKMGRPPKPADVDPMPKSWKPEELLAGCLAYAEASENGANRNLEEDTADFFADQLQHVHDSVSTWQPSTHRRPGGAANKRPSYIYTLEEAKKRRAGDDEDYEDAEE